MDTQTFYRFIADLSGVMWMYVIFFCLILAICFFLLQRRLRKMIRLEKELRESLTKQTQLLDRKKADLEKVMRNIASMKSQVKQMSDQIAEQNVQDDLTGLSTQSFFDKSLDKEWKRAFRGKRPLSLAMIGIDHFKPFSDGYTREEATECIRKIAELLKEEIHRPGDIIARFGEHQFGVLLAETYSDGAWAVADKVRKKVEALSIPNRFSPSIPFITISVGLLSLMPHSKKVPAFIMEKTSQALDAAQADGGNCVKA